MMKKTMKRMMETVVACVMSASLIGCGNSSGSADASNPLEKQGDADSYHAQL